MKNIFLLLLVTITAQAQKLEIPNDIRNAVTGEFIFTGYKSQFRVVTNSTEDGRLLDWREYEYSATLDFNGTLSCLSRVIYSQFDKDLVPFKPIDCHDFNMSKNLGRLVTKTLPCEDSQADDIYISIRTFDCSKIKAYIGDYPISTLRLDNLFQSQIDTFEKEKHTFDPGARYYRIYHNKLEVEQVMPEMIESPHLVNMTETKDIYTYRRKNKALVP